MSRNAHRGRRARFHPRVSARRWPTDPPGGGDPSRATLPLKTLVAVSVAVGCLAVTAMPASAATVAIDGQFTAGTITVDTNPAMSWTIGGSLRPTPA